MPTAPPRPRAAGAAARQAPSSRPAARRRPPDPAALTARRLRIGRVLLVTVLAIATLKLVVVQTVEAGELRGALARQSPTNTRRPAERCAIPARARELLPVSEH